MAAQPRHWHQSNLARSIACRTLLSISLSLGFAPIAAGQGAPNGVAEICPDPAKLRDLCLHVGTKHEDPDPDSLYLYRYQRIIHEAACADPTTESDEVVAAKIQRVWETSETALQCDNSEFNDMKGSVLKYAAYSLFTDFVVDASEVWQVDLNRIDAADGRTVLDYVRDELRMKEGSSVGNKLEYYYDTLREAGARHREEL